MTERNTIEELSQEFNQLELLPKALYANFEDLRHALVTYVNQLINTDFHQLVQLLYRLDIPEKKLRALLATPGQNAGELIADLIIQRQLEKIETRKKFTPPFDDNSGEEQW
jgi:hypothetical protein